MIARLVRPALLIAATAALGACTAYDGYGGTRVSVGYSSGGYYPYGYSRYPYYGWYDGFYYPGTGYYIYDDYGRRYRWSDRHRHYWEGRRGHYRDHHDNWGGYRRDRDGRYRDRDYRNDQRRGEWRRSPDDPRSVTGERRSDRGEARAERRSNRGEARSERRSNRGEARNRQQSDNTERRGGWRR